MRRLLVVVMVFGLLAARQARAQLLTPVWVELGEGGARIARVVIAQAAACPQIEIDGRVQAMQSRGTPPGGFLPACESMIPAAARSARVNGVALALPKSGLSRILVFGDTGCRIKGDEIQNCNDPALWPFLQVAGSAAAEKPDLMIHVGDYLYREDPCPPSDASFCAGTPSGDNWKTWNEDFFAPAAKLLQAAPWVFARGNHENCDRSWRGWSYYLAPSVWKGAACEMHEPAYRIALRPLEIAVLDTSSVNARMSASQVQAYADELASLHLQQGWLVSHHPFWGFGTSDGVAPSMPGLIDAWQKARPHGIALMLAGHVHLFELLSFQQDVPPQLVSGQGGTDMATPIEKPVAGLPIGFTSVTEGATAHEFGYTMLTPAGKSWDVALHASNGHLLKRCRIQERQVSCPPQP